MWTRKIMSDRHRLAWTTASRLVANQDEAGIKPWPEMAGIRKGVMKNGQNMLPRAGRQVSKPKVMKISNCLQPSETLEVHRGLKILRGTVKLWEEPILTSMQPWNVKQMSSNNTVIQEFFHQFS